MGSVYRDRGHPRGAPGVARHSGVTGARADEEPDRERRPQSGVVMMIWVSPAVLKRLWYRTTATTSVRSEEHTSELQSQSNLVCRLLLEKKRSTTTNLLPFSTARSSTPPCVSDIPFDSPTPPYVSNRYTCRTSLTPTTRLTFPHE